MNEADAIVVRVEGEVAWVRFDPRGGACGACNQQAQCNAAGRVGTVSPQGPDDLLCLSNQIHAQPGDRVVVCTADGQVLRAAWCAYILPLLLGIGGATAGMALTGGDVGAGVGILIGLAMGFFLSHRVGLESRAGEPMLTLRFKYTT